MKWGTPMFGNVTTQEGLHVTGRYKTKHDAHILQACGLGSSHTSRATQRRVSLGGVREFRGLKIRQHTLQGYLAHKRQPPPRGHHKALGTVLLLVPRGTLFLISEVPLYSRVDMRG